MLIANKIRETNWLLPSKRMVRRFLKAKNSVIIDYYRFSHIIAFYCHLLLSLLLLIYDSRGCSHSSRGCKIAIPVLEGIIVIPECSFQLQDARLRSRACRDALHRWAASASKRATTLCIFIQRLRGRRSPLRCIFFPLFRSTRLFARLVSISVPVSFFTLLPAAPRETPRYLSFPRFTRRCFSPSLASSKPVSYRQRSLRSGNIYFFLSHFTTLSSSGVNS